MPDFENVVLLALTLGACTPTAEPAPANPAEPARPPASEVEPSPQASSQPAVPATAVPRAVASPSGPTSPPPLSGSTGGPLPFAATGDGGAQHGDRGARGSTASCHQGVVKAKLQAMVRQCRKSSESICGTVTVHADRSGKAVRVEVDVNSTTGSDAFTTCVTRHVNAVAWECVASSGKISVDLGCRL